MSAATYRPSRRSFRSKAAILVLALVGVRAAAQTERVLYSFTSEGTSPIAGVVQDKTGNLYGTTPDGGASGCGTVFKLAPPATQGGRWTQTEIYGFGGIGFDGCRPADDGSLVIDEKENLYGTTQDGGEFGYGTVFQLTPPSSGETWNETVLYSFGGGTDAQLPYDGLIRMGSGLYGATVGGGESGAGAVFRLTPGKNGGPWKEAVLYSFTGGSDGGPPSASPTAGPGVLYGVAAAGLYGNGVVYQLSPPTDGSNKWTETVLHSFPDGNNDGLLPAGALILDKDGALYGTTFGSNPPLSYGLVFTLTPPNWAETILYNFTDGSDGEDPQAGLTIDASGALYGTTRGLAEQGGNQGSVFKLTPPSSSGDSWTETTLHAFTGGSDGGTPLAGLLLKKGLLYGTTYEGGPNKDCNCGVVFAIRP